MRSLAGAGLVVLGWLAGAAMVGVALRLPPDDVDLRHHAGTTFGLVTLVVLVAAGVAAQRASAAPSLHPSRLVVGRGRFEVPTCVSIAYVTAAQPVLFGLIVIAQLPRVRQPPPPGVSATWIFVVAIVAPIAVCAYLTLPFAAREVAGQPGLSINDDGVRIRVKVNQWREIPWGAFDQEQPAVLRGSILTLRAERPDQVRSGGLLLGRRRRYTTIQVRHRLAVDPEFLVAVIDLYARHPDERLGIGTEGGYSWLRVALAESTPAE